MRSSCFDHDFPDQECMLTLLDRRNSGIGGTWFENRYPGCACDVPAHAYTYSFEPNPNWSSFYAYSAEIKKYFEDFAHKYDLHPFVKLNSKVLSASWVEEKGICELPSVVEAPT